MKRSSVKISSLLLVMIFVIPVISFAGNEQRAGQAGASELLINPWARSSGWAGANTACIRGLEAIHLNVAGSALTRKTELIFARTDLLSGTGISINTFGFSQKIGETGCISLAIMSIDFGEIEITTVQMPEGGMGTFHPQFNNIALAYAKEFSNSIFGGVVVKVINEAISDLTASGVALDAGIQYVTGTREHIKFGISMKNVGPTMRFSGDGFSFRGVAPDGDDYTMTIEQRSADFELPSLIKIGAAYDLKLPEDHKVTLAGNFTSNSFTKDRFHAGLQYSYKNILILRGGYVYEEGLYDENLRTTAYTGPTAGVSLQIPMNKEKGSAFSIDYSYRSTFPFNGTHCIGAKVSL